MPVASLLIARGRFPKILGLFQGLKIGVPSGCLEETSVFEIIMIDDVTLWSKLESIHGKSTRFYLFCFIYGRYDIQDVSAQTVGGIVTF